MAEGCTNLLTKSRRGPPKTISKPACLRSTFATPYIAAGRRLVDDIIEPAQTRKHLAQALDWMRSFGIGGYIAVVPGSNAERVLREERQLEPGYAWMKSVPA